MKIKIFSLINFLLVLFGFKFKPAKSLFDSKVYSIDFKDFNCSSRTKTEVVHSQLKQSGVEYRILKNYSLFEINSKTGQVYINLKFNQISSRNANYKLKLLAVDKNTNASLDQAVLSVNINCARSDNIGVIIKFLFADSLSESLDFNYIIFNNQMDTNQTFYLAENTLVDSFISYVLVKSSSHFEIRLSDDQSEKFKLNRIDFGSSSLIDSTIYPVINLYSLKLAQTLDRESKDLYKLSIYSNQSHEAHSNLNIIVTDTNDNSPKFEYLNYNFKLSENNPKDTCIGYVKAFDLDLGENGTVEYFFLNNSLIGYKQMDLKEYNLSDEFMDKTFMVNSNSGELCIRESLDREEFERFKFRVIAKDKGKPVEMMSEDSSQVLIDLIDVNDNKPIFYLNQSSNRDFYLEEDSQPKSFIGCISAFDLDLNENSQIDYYLEGVGNYGNENILPFYIDSYGILKNLYRFKIIDENYSISETLIENSIFHTRNSNFSLKIIAQDRSRDKKLLSSIEINVFLIQSEDLMFNKSQEINLGNKLNKTVFYVTNELTNKQPIVNLASNTMNSTFSRFQLIPVVYDEANEYSKNNEYGFNCNQDQIFKYFNLNENGDVYLRPLNWENKDMVCFLNVRILELKPMIGKPSKLISSTSIELIFIIAPGKDLDSNGREEMLNKAYLIKSRNLSLFSNMALSKKSNYENLHNSKKILESNNQFYLIYFTVIAVLVLIFLILAFVYSNKFKIVKNLSAHTSCLSFQPESSANLVKSTITDSANSSSFESNNRKQIFDFDLQKAIETCNKSSCDFQNENEENDVLNRSQKMKSLVLKADKNASLESSTSCSYLINNNLNNNFKENQEYLSPGSSANSSLMLNASNENLNDKKICYGIYQVANQIIIDYDDNTSREVNCKKNEALNKSLKRFENIYYYESPCAQQNTQESRIEDVSNLKRTCQVQENTCDNKIYLSSFV